MKYGFADILSTILHQNQPNRCLDPPQKQRQLITFFLLHTHAFSFIQKRIRTFSDKYAHTHTYACTHTHRYSLTCTCYDSIQELQRYNHCMEYLLITSCIMYCTDRLIIFTKGSLNPFNIYDIL